MRALARKLAVRARPAGALFRKPAVRARLAGALARKLVVRARLAGALARKLEVRVRLAVRAGASKSRMLVPSAESVSPPWRRAVVPDASPSHAHAMPRAHRISTSSSCHRLVRRLISARKPPISPRQHQPLTSRRRPMKPPSTGCLYGRAASPKPTSRADGRHALIRVILRRSSGMMTLSAWRDAITWLGSVKGCATTPMVSKRLLTRSGGTLGLRVRAVRARLAGLVVRAGRLRQ